jgi:hypothetical protein
MRARPWLCAFLVACAAAGGMTAPSSSAAPPCGGVQAEALLMRSRDAFRARKTPPYVVYTIERRETVNGMPDLGMTYERRIWYRSADGAALTRRVWQGRAVGGLIFERPRFNAALDPGPPTADIFEPAPPRPIPQATSRPGPELPEIGSVSTHVELDYRANIVECTAAGAHVRLTARRDPDRNRLRDLWIDPSTAAVRRFVAADRLYHGISDVWDPDVADAAFAAGGDVPLIATIHMVADTQGGEDISDYRFEAVSFPASLPGWYFDPATYRPHVAEAPVW